MELVGFCAKEIIVSLSGIRLAKDYKDLLQMSGSDLLIDSIVPLLIHNSTRLYTFYIH